jgi:hypothetical protein
LPWSTAVKHLSLVDQSQVHVSGRLDGLVQSNAFMHEVSDASSAQRQVC